MIYLDNAGTTKIDDSVLNAMLPYLKESYGNASSLHSLGQHAKEDLENARNKIASCLNANAKEIFFTSGGSEADNQAIISASTMGARKNKFHNITIHIINLCQRMIFRNMKSKNLISFHNIISIFKLLF